MKSIWSQLSKQAKPRESQQSQETRQPRESQQAQGSQQALSSEKSHAFKLTLNIDARRTSISAQLREALGPVAWATVTSEVMAAGLPKKHQHNFAEILHTIDTLTTTESIKNHMKAVYEILATAEASAHKCRIEETHFHEVGNAEAVLNALLLCLAFNNLSSTYTYATSVQVGAGKIKCAHGELEIPAPATRSILESHNVPVCQTRLQGELCTPTSAAIIAHFVDEFVEA